MKRKLQRSGRRGVCALLVASITLASLLSIVSPLRADTGRVLRVCTRGCPYASVSEALAAASPGDVVQVGPGIYLDHIFMRPGVIIRGDGSNVSIITGADEDTVVRASGPAIGPDAVLEGLTIVSGKSASGGGIEIRDGASPTIRNNLITANRAVALQGQGGGLFISGGAPLISNNVFSKNRSDWGGGALAIWDDSRAVVLANRFEENSAYQFGGAISISGASPILAGNVVISNTAYYGGAIDVAGGSPEFSANTITDNTAQAHGGGVHVHGSSTALIVGNTFATNVCYYYGGGLYIDRSTPTVSGNTFSYNVADTGGAIYADRSSPTISRNTITHNDASFHGGGVHFHNAAGALDENAITYNTAIVGGGGIGMDGRSSPLVTNNVLSNNAAGLYGGAFYIEGAAPQVINNLITNNASSNIAGGIYAESSSPLIRNNTIAGNGLAGSGEGIYLGARTSPTITNNIIVSNGYGIYAAALGGVGDAGSLIMRNNVWNNRYANFLGISDTTNIDADPLFVRGREGSYYLSQVSYGQGQTSPAVDAGIGRAAELGLAGRTTSVRDLPDEGAVDLGYHYRALPFRSYAPIILQQP